MTDDEIRAEIAKQIHETLALLATKLRATAKDRARFARSFGRGA